MLTDDCSIRVLLFPSTSSNIYSGVFPTLQGLHNDITTHIVGSTVIVNDEKLKPTITLYMLQYISSLKYFLFHAIIMNLSWKVPLSREAYYT